MTCPECGGAMTPLGDCRDPECSYSVPVRSGELIQVAVGRCPACGDTEESADRTGLEGLTCAKGHEPCEYVPADAYYEDEAQTWADD